MHDDAFWLVLEISEMYFKKFVVLQISYWFALFQFLVEKTLCGRTKSASS